jgi:hypothetical protein
VYRNFVLGYIGMGGLWKQFGFFIFPLKCKPFPNMCQSQKKKKKKK